jgi:glycosyltransferase involved in cell wall biosynthesis
MTRGVKNILLMCEFEKSELAGCESVILGLIEGLVSQGDPRFRYVILTTESMRRAIAHMLPSPHSVIARPNCKSNSDNVKDGLRNAFPSAVALFRKIVKRPTQGLPAEVSELDAFSEALFPDLIHWLYPLHYARSQHANICTVHDLNYEHLEEGFTEDYKRWRRILMREQVRRADLLVTISDFVSHDLENHYPESQSKIKTVKWAPYIQQERGKLMAQQGVGLIEGSFILYPAATYKHKNHRKLFEAISLINKRGHSPVRLFLTGPVTNEWHGLQEDFKNEMESSLIHHLGFVSKQHLEVLYKSCSLVVFPSLFEGAGLPLLEAITLHKKICCSDIPVFREYGGDYPIYFDPESASSIAEAIKRSLAGNPPESRITYPTWAEIAQDYLALYEMVLRLNESS